jgi:hypothetical protein
MTLRQFIASVRCHRKSLSVTAFLGAATSLTGPGLSFASGDEPLVTNVGQFQIPFDVETEPGQKAEGFAVLFGSQNGGANWEQLQSVPASQDAFMFAAPRDGRYSFAIRMTDPRGNVTPPAKNTAAELDVVVDTVSPDLKVELFESAPGQILINWTCTDVSVNPDTLSIEFADGTNGRWKPVSVDAVANGQAVVPAGQGSVIAVRAQISDAAGNRGEASTQLVLQGVSQAPVAGPMTAPPMPVAIHSTPMGPSPFGAPPQNRPTSNSPSGNQPTSSVPSGYPTQAMSGTVAPVPQSPPPAVGYPQATATANFGGNYGAPMSSQVSATVPAMSGLSGFHNPMSSPSGGDEQLVNTHVFDVDYQVEDVGPSGVSAVELFVTENGGQQWFRYGNDTDLRSPFQVDAQGEGTFGFAVRVRNGLGFADAPPQPGQAPEIVVTVDEAAPAVELAQPSVRVDGFGTVQLAWRVTDLHPAPSPVRLEYSTTPNGPWTPVFDWQADQGGFDWSIRPGTPSSLYFRLLARDAAGNVGAAQTPQPVIVDLKKPVGRLLRVQAASHSIAPRN